MKNLKTILSEIKGMAGEEYDYLADAQRAGEISLATYYRACEQVGLEKSEAAESLRKNYQAAGVEHLCPA